LLSIDLFAIDVEFHTELSNHLHLVLRTCPEAARRWSRAEVARRWLTITKLAKCLSDDLPKPDPRRVEQLAKDKKKIDKLRLRLCSVSWFMGILSGNRELPDTGHFIATTDLVSVGR
jgi:hypothetical protein